jgi:type I restriction enzyme S subunit
MLQSPQIRKVIDITARSTSGVHNINSAELAALAIPCPELVEQQEIVRRIETAFAWLDRVATEHTNASRLLPKLDQAILAKAFRGELVLSDGQPRPLADAERV